MDLCLRIKRKIVKTRNKLTNCGDDKTNQIKNTQIRLDYILEISLSSWKIVIAKNLSKTYKTKTPNNLNISRSKI